MSCCYDEACRLVKSAIAAFYHAQTLESCTDNPSRKTATPLLCAYIHNVLQRTSGNPDYLLTASYMWNDLATNQLPGNQAVFFAMAPRSCRIALISSSIAEISTDICGSAFTATPAEMAWSLTA